MKTHLAKRSNFLLASSAGLLCAALLLFPGPATGEGSTKPIQIPGVSAAAESAADNVVIAGQPSKETLEAAAKKGIKVVVNLRRPDEMAKLPLDEKSIVESLGMKYINVPMSSALPKEDGVKTLLDTLGDSKANPVLLHCASGNRAGGIWALYSGVRKGLPADAAIAEGKAAGLNNDALEHVVRNRIAASAKK